MYTYRFLSIIIWVLVPFISSGQTEGQELRKQFNQLYDSGRYDEALLKADAAIAYWKSRNQKDSTNYYKHRHAHTLGVMGNPSESVAQSAALSRDLEANPPLPSFMGSVYFTYGSNLLYLSEFTKALEILDKSIAFESQRTKPDTLMLAKALEWKGLVGIYTDDLEQSQILIEQALELRYAIFDSTAKEIAYNLNSLGSLYDERGFKAKAGVAFEKAYKILQIHLPADHPQLLSVASNLSITKSEMGEIDEAVTLLQDAIAVHEKQKAYYSLMNEYHNMGSIYSMLEDLEKARIYLTKGLNLADSLLPNPHFYRANMYDGLGGIYFSEGKNDKADSLFYLALRQRELAEEPSDNELGQSAFNLAMVSQERKDTAKAHKYYSESYDRRIKAYGLDHPKTANSLFGLADIHWWKGNHVLALSDYRKCAKIYSKTVTNQSQWTIETLITLARRYDQIAKPDSSEIFLKKSWEAVFNLQENTVDLRNLSQYPIQYVDPYVLNLVDFHLDYLLKNIGLHAEKADEGIEVMKTMDGLITQLLPYLNFESESNTILPLIKGIYRKGVLLANKQSGSNDNFKPIFISSLEQSRSASIRAALQNRQAMQYANVPDSVVENDRKLREELRYVQARAKDEQNEYWNGLRFETLNRWRTYQNYLHKSYPEWYEVCYAPTLPTITEIQESLAETDASLVAYFDADTTLAVIVASATVFNTLLLEMPEGWQDSVRTYRQLIENRAAPQRLAGLSHYLYQILWQPIENQVKERVLIMPDGPLNYLNFETLISAPTAESDYKSWAWLIKKHTFIRRNTLPGPVKAKQFQNQDAPHGEEGILAISPGFSDELKAEYRKSLPANTAADTTFTSWVQTPWSIEFAKELKPRGKVLVGAAANEKSFRENASNAGILHFGTHAHLQDANPLLSYLALTPTPNSNDDGYLYAYELYNQPLHANLAVLTACETGLGAYREGDGVISLAYAFQYAGCPNVVYSLWQIDDKQSTWLIKQFYKHIESNMPYSDALRMSKLDYMSKHSGELTAPYYWGGVVITGDDGKIENSTSIVADYGWPIGLAFGALGLILIWSFGKKRKTNAS